MKLLIQKGSVLQGSAVSVSGIMWTVVLDGDDQPIAAIEQVGNGVVMVTTCSDNKFVDILKRLGVGKAPLVREATE